MSLRPGIGAGPEESGIQLIQDMLETEWGCDLITELNDVPDIIKLCGKEMLLGQYLKNKLRDRIGVDEETRKAKLSLLREEKIQEYKEYLSQPEAKAIGQKAFLLEKHKQKVRDIEKRFSLHKPKGEI
jgi:hypothetical protein